MYKMDRFFACLLLIGIELTSTNDALTQDFYWRDYAPGDIPYDAFRCDEGKYIGQVLHANQNLPATIYPHSNIAVAELYGKQEIKENIKILCTPDPSRLYWEKVNFNRLRGNQMENVVKGGYIGINLFIGKIFTDDEWKIGKVAPFESPDKGIHIWNQENKWVTFFDVIN